MHVLEHAPNPNKIIEEIKGNAKYYYFEVPKDNVSNKEFWHEHINCFSMDSFSYLLSKHFKIMNKEVVNQFSSDHRALFATLVLESEI